MKVHFLESSNAPVLSVSQETEYRNALTVAYQNAKSLLPSISNGVNFVVQPLSAKYARKLQNGEHGRTVNSEHICLNYTSVTSDDFDTLLVNMPKTVFHELNHAARYQYDIWHHTFLDSCILEGLAVVFARDHADYTSEWSKYNEQECLKWINEIRGIGKEIKHLEYMFSHPDGRQWIGYKVGTFIIDKAIATSKKTVVELTSLECDEILKLSRLQ